MTTDTSLRRGFASDNASGVHPEVLAAIARVNEGHAVGYGQDDYTRLTERRIAQELSPEAEAEAFLVWGGSGANVLCLRAACRPWEAVICAQTAHINVDECGAPEVLAGVKLLALAGEHGKLTPELVESQLVRLGDEHAVQPRLVSVSQCTERGTVYTPAELRALAEHAHQHGMLLHVDGARLTNAAAALGVSLRALTGEAGVDLVSFGGTKAGLLGAEAVVLLDPRLAEGFEYLRKQSLQLASKMRYLAAQFDALLSDELWRRCCAHANEMGALLRDGLRGLDGVHITTPVQTNAVFAVLPAGVVRALGDGFEFPVWDQRLGEMRWMCSWDTTADDVRALLDALKAALGQTAPH